MATWTASRMPTSAPWPVLRLALSLGLALLATLPGLPAHAQGGLHLIHQDYANHFPTSLVFTAEAEGPSPIQSATLFYKVKGARSSAYAYAEEFTPDTRVRVEYTLRNNTQRTYLPPGAEVRYYWVFEDSSGGQLETPETVAVFEDIRFPWDRLTQDQVTLYWYQRGQNAARDLLERAVTTLERLASQAGIAYQDPVKIFVYASKADMDPALPLRSPTYSSQIVTLGIVLNRDTIAILGNQADLEETLTHELTHLVTGQLTESPFVDLPAWLNEGLSMVAEEKLNPRYLQVLQQAAREGQLISVRSLSALPGDPGQVTLFYAEAHSLVDYLLRSYGQGRFQELIAVLKEGNRFNDALQRVYGFDVDGLEAAWRASLGLQPATATPVPRSTLQPAVPTPSGELGGEPAQALPWPLIAGLAGAVVLALGLAGGLALMLLRRR